MTTQDILELTRAGWSKDDIIALTSAISNTAEIVQNDGNTDVNGNDLDESAGQNAQTTQNESPSQDFTADIKELRDSIAQLTRVVQNNNLITRTTEQAQVESVDDILKKLI